MFFFFQAEDGIRYLVRSRGLGDVYKRQIMFTERWLRWRAKASRAWMAPRSASACTAAWAWACLLYTSDAADERSSVDLGGRRIIKKKKKTENTRTGRELNYTTEELAVTIERENGHRKKSTAIEK